MHLMKGGGGVAHYDRVYRAYFSAINPSDIMKAYNSLGKPDKNQALSVDARQELDLKVGVAFSRFQTRFFQGRYGDLDSSVLSCTCHVLFSVVHAFKNAVSPFACLCTPVFRRWSVSNSHHGFCGSASHRY
jgi:hypothetical protein